MMELPAMLVERMIARGTIIHSDDIHGIDHGKFFVVIGVSADFLVGFFFINSGINKYLLDKPAQLGLQYPLRSADYSFLSHDSYIGGASLIRYRRDTLVAQLQSGTAKMVGTLMDRDMENLLQLCRDSKLYSVRDKRNFMY